MQYNIFQNDFYESRPGIPWAYRLTAEYGPFAERTVVIQKAIKEANLPEMEQKYIQVHFGGADKYVPTRYQNFGTFSLTFNENCNLSAYKSILGLFRRSFDNREDIGIPGENQPTRHYKYSNLYGELKFIVEILDPKNINLQDTKVTRELFGLEREANDLRVVAKYEFGECYIDHIDDLDLDYGSEEIVEWGMTVAYNSISVSYPGQKSLRLGIEDEFRETAFTAYDNYEGYNSRNSIRISSALVGKIARENFDRETKKRFDDKAAYESAIAELEKEKAQAKKIREDAMGKHSEEANDEGYANGTYTTAAQKEAAINSQVEEINRNLVDSFKEEHNYYKWLDQGIDLENMSEEEIRKTAEEKVKTHPTGDGTGYGVGDWQLGGLVEKAVQAKRDWEKSKSELVAASEAAEQEVRFANRDIGVVEMRDTPEAKSYYDESQSEFDKRGQRIRAQEKIIRNYEDDIEGIKKKLADNRASKRNMQEKAEYAKAYSKELTEKRNKMEEAVKELEAIKAEQAKQ